MWRSWRTDRMKSILKISSILICIDWLPWHFIMLPIWVRRFLSCPVIDSLLWILYCLFFCCVLSFGEIMKTFLFTDRSALPRKQQKQTTIQEAISWTMAESLRQYFSRSEFELNLFNLMPFCCIMCLKALEYRFWWWSPISRNWPL